MIKGNRICFGYGSVATSHTFNVLKFVHFKPPQEIGMVLNPIWDQLEMIGKPILIPVVSLDEVKELYELLDNVNGNECTEFTFKDYVFDFSNYNAESVNVVKKAVDGVRNSILFVSAC